MKRLLILILGFSTTLLGAASLITADLKAGKTTPDTIEQTAGDRNPSEEVGTSQSKSAGKRGMQTVIFQRKNDDGD